MFISQVSVFLENRQGRLDEFATLMGDNGIDLLAISIADTTNFGLLRVIVDDCEKTLEVLQANGYTAKCSPVLAVTIPDEPGGLATALRLLRQADISIEYLYTLMRRVGDRAVIIFRVNKPDEAAALFTQNGIGLLRQEEMGG